MERTSEEIFNLFGYAEMYIHNYVVMQGCSGLKVFRVGNIIIKLKQNLKETKKKHLRPLVLHCTWILI